MPDQSFQDRVAKIQQQSSSSKSAKMAAPKSEKTGNGRAILAGVQGFLAQTSILFLNANYEKIKADVVDAPLLKYVFAGLLLFVVVSYLGWLWGAIRRAFSAKARKKGWNPIIGFAFGATVASLTLKLMAAGA